MRSQVGIIALLALGACGGDDNGGDITNPPGAGTVTLTVSGQGAGSGHVGTSSGITPAIDCAIANSQASGTCSGNYGEASVVSLVVAPDANSRFDGWAGDAASCSTSLTCSIAMTGDKTAVAQFSAAPSTSGVQVISSAYYPDPTLLDNEGAIIWVAEVQNQTSDWIETAEVNFTSHDQAGNVLASSLTFVGPIPPGETRANEGIADYSGNEGAVDIQLGEVQTGTANPLFAGINIVSSNWRLDPDLGEIVWTVEVENTSGTEVEDVKVDFLTYDATGKIVDAATTFVGSVPAGERRSAESTATSHGTEANVKFQVADVI